MADDKTDKKKPFEIHLNEENEDWNRAKDDEKSKKDEKSKQASLAEKLVRLYKASGR